jgi:hypothetical protein
MRASWLQVRGTTRRRCRWCQRPRRSRRHRRDCGRSSCMSGTSGAGHCCSCSRANKLHAGRPGDVKLAPCAREGTHRGRSTLRGWYVQGESRPTPSDSRRNRGGSRSLFCLPGSSRFIFEARRDAINDRGLEPDLVPRQLPRAIVLLNEQDHRVPLLLLRRPGEGIGLGGVQGPVHVHRAPRTIL